jgi:glycosyltransferase involved in cell wall biosynthesis
MPGCAQTGQPALSVVICTHNPNPAYLARCLSALRAQTLCADAWELLVIDNRCDEPLARRLEAAGCPRARIVREETLGLTPARLRGIREARGELLVFVDDDNVLDPDYLTIARSVAKEKPFLGAWSGQCVPEFETPPPDWMRPYWGQLALREVSGDRWSNLPRAAETLPNGAGLCVRRDVARRYLNLHETGERSFQLDRTGASLLSGGDQDLAACACDLGYGAGVIAALRLTHLIPAARLTLDYHRRLTEGIYFSSVVLAFLRGAEAELRGYRVTWTHVARALLTTGAAHRRIQLACLRGRRRGLAQVARMSR